MRNVENSDCHELNHFFSVKNFNGKILHIFNVYKKIRNVILHIEKLNTLKLKEKNVGI